MIGVLCWQAACAFACLKHQKIRSEWGRPALFVPRNWNCVWPCKKQKCVGEDHGRGGTMSETISDSLPPWAALTALAPTDIALIGLVRYIFLPFAVRHVWSMCILERMNPLGWLTRA